MHDEAYTFPNGEKGKNQLKTWIWASRPRTLPVSLPPILIGTALASHSIEKINWMLPGMALLCSLGIQIGTNLINDAWDFKKGADGKERLGPQRVTQSGLLSFNQVLTAGCISFGFAFLFGIPLMLTGGWPLFFILIISIACGYFYTGGPLPLSYTGISDLFVLIFFGWISTCTIYYLQTGNVSTSCFLAATQIGLLSVVPHAINNLRDHAADSQVNKRTLAVRFGKTFARWEIAFLSLSPFILGLFWLKINALWMFFSPIFCIADDHSQCGKYFSA